MQIDHRGLDLDTSDLVYQDIDTRLLKWMQVILTMQQYISATRQSGLHDDGVRESEFLVRRLVKYVEDNSKEVNERLSKDTYRSSR